MNVSYSPRSLAQLADIHDYIRRHNPRAAKDVIIRIQELCERLGDFPGMGHATDQAGIRVLPVVRYPYLIVYTIIDAADEVRILRIRHGRRRPLVEGEI